MKNKTFYLGGGQTSFGEHYDQSLLDLTLTAIESALSDSQQTISQIDAIFVSSMLAGTLNQQHQLNSVIAEAYNYNKPIIRVEAACASGGMAIWNAQQYLAAHSEQNVLVVGVEKMTDHSTQTISRGLMQATSLAEQKSGISFAGLYALMAQAYMSKFQQSETDLAKFSSFMHSQAVTNEKAQFRKAISIDGILQSPMVSEPLKLLDCSPISDGAAAVVLSNYQENSIILKEVILTTDTPAISKRDTLTSIPATKKAAAKLYTAHEINANQISVVELHDCFSIAGLIALEDLGFCQPGTGSQLIDDSANLVINPSGGLKACGHPVGATGVKQISEVATWLMKNPAEQYGICHNIGGTGGTCVLSLIENLTATNNA